MPNRLTPVSHHFALPGKLLLAGFAGFVILASCSDSNNPAPIGIADEPIVAANASLPGVVVTIEDVLGSGGSGKARVGDRLVVDFTVQTESGAPLELSNLQRGAIMVSGPTFNYQRVIASQSDLRERSIKRALGAYRYTFDVQVPGVYVAPLNDTTALTEGELTGQALLAGTYTVGIELRKDYAIGGVTYRDPGNASRDFLIGGATEVVSREVVTLANCNQCHGELRAHGDNRNNLTNCLLCHTAGSEDRNTAGVANGTPGRTVDFKVMIHKIHAGKHLPSVNGVTTNPDGTRDYAATKKPYQLIGFGDRVIDFSEIAFPVWPSLAYPMPRDLGYGALSSSQRSLEDSMRSASVDCTSCHGDPDGAGPLPAPAQGDLAYTQPSVSACASCHDDWNPDHLYTANGQTMPAERNNATCKECHRQSGGPLDVRDAHVHPLVDPAFAEGLRFEVQSIADVPTAGAGNNAFDVNERVRVTMTIKDGSGADVPATALSRIEAVINGPTSNPNLVHYVRVPSAALGSGPSYTFNLPQSLYYEPVGSSDAGTLNEMFTTTRAPHWNVSGAETELLLRTGTGAGSTLATNAVAYQNYIDLAVGGGANFASGDFVVIEDGQTTRREFLRAQRVDGDRLWFSSAYSQNYAPGLRGPHALGSSVDKVIVPVNGSGQPVPIPTSSYSLDATTGIVTETTEFGAGEVLVTYTSDFLVPPSYTGTFNESPDLDQSWGDWVGLPILSGTYNIGIWGRRDLSFPVSIGGASQSTTYREAADPAVTPVLFGTATTLSVINRIDSSEGCYRCHTDIQFHGGGRKGYDTCLLCHGVAGAEDAATYVYANGEASPGVTIDFRTMLHKIHAGKTLAAGENYKIAGFGGNGHSYEHVGYPFMPGGVSNCASCHGENSTAWVEPAERLHPMAMVPTRSWRAACASCHDTTAAQAHIDANTSPSGGEACAICHGVGEDEDVRSVHTVK
tara:strand:+ start:9292 stop:12180 length:2889 start_codon:yes stop_codon:yes gene_type:complete